MANSSAVDTIKNRVVKKFIKDSSIIDALHVPKIGLKPEEYVGEYIFTYNQNPFTLNDVQTFITVQVHIPKSFDRNKTFVIPTLEIWIISHERHMKVSEIPKVTSNRNDYISQLIDKKLNGKRGIFPIGVAELSSNVEGSFQKDYLYRKMIFEGRDINNSACDRDDE